MSENVNCGNVADRRFAIRFDELEELSLVVQGRSTWRTVRLSRHLHIAQLTLHVIPRLGGGSAKNSERV